MTTLEMLHEIEEHKVIYEIAYRNAGIGFVFYEGRHDETGAPQANWKAHLTVETYYDSFEEAVAAEYARLPDARSGEQK